MTSPEQKIIVALDLPDRAAILALARRLCGEVGMVKVGLEAFVAHGPDLVRALADMGHKIFLDLKIHDIPRTAAAAVRQASALNVQMLTVHASGGAEMLRAACEASSAQIVAVTMLTSLDDAAARATGFAQGVAQTAYTMGALARQSGVAGLVCSAHELPQLSALGGSRVVPGVRADNAAADDQKRTATAAHAVQQGATWVVIGRPILQAPDPVVAVRQIAAGLHGR